MQKKIGANPIQTTIQINPQNGKAITAIHDLYFSSIFFVRNMEYMANPQIS